MRTHKLLLCTDMDRTVIPNGHQQEHPDAPEQFRHLCRLPDVKLVYVTGRHLQLVCQAIADYNLPQPEFVITDVGTKIYQRRQTEYHELLSWQDKIAGDWRDYTHGQLHQMLDKFSELDLQEQSKQNDFKLSYYLSLNVDHGSILRKVEHQLLRLGIATSLILSVDEPEQVALLDVLPYNATKLHAIEFLQQHLGYGYLDTIFAGDSGNDLPVLGSRIQSVLVANADPDVRKQALQLAEENGNTESFYLARQENSSLGGNYTAGVLQGIRFFAPKLMKEIEMS